MKTINKLTWVRVDPIRTCPLYMCNSKNAYIVRYDSYCQLSLIVYIFLQVLQEDFAEIKVKTKQATHFAGVSH